jgi:hypothetical protein
MFHYGFEALLFCMCFITLDCASAQPASIKLWTNGALGLDQPNATERGCKPKLPNIQPPGTEISCRFEAVY